MDKKEKQFNIKQRNLKGGPIIFILSAVILLVIVSGNYFSFLEKQLFEERKNHIVEFTDKASEIVDSVIEYSWQQVSACEYVVKSKELICQIFLMKQIPLYLQLINMQIIILPITTAGAGHRQTF